ncbi:hypothetical protein CPB84DRAFT_1417083 [Gymnopilus junonius]|uniref:Uncharacterized protein n=1 Tax=Gymnopilus junonius TaxID=109634 RepID=A0A9P5NKW4_GYMJU|nr:hypothetical protein CPB84DRAFT_1417083 [Gymnopilus junonius]
MKGRAQGKHHVYSCLAELLQQNWSRLRRVDVRIGPEALYHSSLWKTFLFPAPQLVSFKVVFQGTRPRIFSSQDGFLFAGNAPSLREIGTKNMTFSIQAPWAAQLRQLQLESADFKAYETLEVIKQMPLLEYLSLSHIAGPPPVPLPAEESINIPRLTHLHLTNKLNIALPFVHAIKSSNHCTLIWASPAIDFGIPAQEAIYAIRRVLIRYSNGFFSSQSTPGALRLI